eukprot:1353868-Prymnesium_polylepis.1
MIGPPNESWNAMAASPMAATPVGFACEGAADSTSVSADASVASTAAGSSTGAPSQGSAIAFTRAERATCAIDRTAPTGGHAGGRSSAFEGSSSDSISNMKHAIIDVRLRHVSVKTLRETDGTILP